MLIAPSPSSRLIDSSSRTMPSARLVRMTLSMDSILPGGSSWQRDTVEPIVGHPEVNIRGMLLTLKLPHWQLAAQVPAYIARIRSWGFNLVRARKLAHNRREICTAALQKPFRRKPAG